MPRLLGGLFFGTLALVAGCGDIGSPTGGGNDNPDLRMVTDMQTGSTVDLRPPAGFDMSSATVFPMPRNCNTQTVVTGATAYRTLTNNNARCLGGGCHGSIIPKFTNQATFMTATINVKSTSDYPYVAPFNPDRSFLLYKLRNLQANVRNGGGTQMPRNGTPLTDAEVCTIYTWILRGAPAN